MTSLSEHTGDTFSAYFCVVLFDSLGYELHAQDIQETRGAGGIGVHCTLDIEKAQALAQTTGKQILIAEFSPSPRLPSRSGANGLLLAGSEDLDKCAWRQRGFAGVLYDGTELILTVEAIHALYRREWRRLEEPAEWDGLQRLMAAMTEPPLSIDSDSVRSDAAWAKALERLKRYGDDQVLQSKDKLEQAWQNRHDARSSCSVC
mmetsp:Transcript_64954/g.120920  ORF Transcript_64954/g.120920 Transcript_64954/m.120920 type:complete len:204 (-) Transcript_64954:13-624(-)